MNTQYMSTIASTLLCTLLISTSACALVMKDPQDLSSTDWFAKRNTSPYFDPKQLADSETMRAKLKSEEGFQEVDFKASDGVQLKGLMRFNPNAEYTLINFCGFFPGKKEGMATLVELFPKNINLLLVDARGHGQSKGPFVSCGGNYGLTEHHDVIGAIKFTHEKTRNKPIIVHGLCMGGRHATFGLAHLSSTRNVGTSLSQLAEYNVRGFICDSAPTKASSLKGVLTQEVTQKMLPQWFKKVPGYNIPKKELIQTRAFRASASVLSGVVTAARYVWFDINGGDLNEITGATNSQGKAAHITCPVFFIHPRKDSYICCDETQCVAKEVNDKVEWYDTDESEHVQLHVKNPGEYARRCSEFIKNALSKPVIKEPSAPMAHLQTADEIYSDSKMFWDPTTF